MKKIVIFLFLAVSFLSCISTKSTIKNIDNEAVKPLIKDGMFVITTYAEDKNYGYEADYPINLGVINENAEATFVAYFFKGLAGAKSENVIYKKIETCCPFPSTNSNMGVGLLSLYEFNFEGSDKKNVLYFNIYEKGKIMCPKGFSIKKTN